MCVSKDFGHSSCLCIGFQNNISVNQLYWALLSKVEDSQMKEQRVSLTKLMRCYEHVNAQGEDTHDKIRVILLVSIFQVMF